MWNTSIKIEYITGLIVDALENYSVNGEYTQFNHVIEELRKHFTNCSDEEITDIISLCMKMYSSKKIEHAELVLTAPDSFHIKTLRTKDIMRKLIENAEKSLTITGYSISDYFAEMLDVIIKKSQQRIITYAHLYHRCHRAPLQKRIYHRSAISRISLQDIGICIPHGDRREACDLSGTLSSIQNVCASI